ncbi:hypothetical protein DFJ74DRAFT_629332 [Hyaloraphidium curvatum]|nr:hypothetical protein DFJ74DRAFT_629332 [Hyaloraphidium curvatum]
MSHLASSHSRVAGDDDAASDGASSDGEAAPRPRAPGKLDPTFVNTKYACRRPTPLRSPNDALCADLQTLAEAREFNGDEMNSLAYRRAVAAVRAYPRKLTNPAEAKGIIGVGPKIATKIDEFIMAGRITEAALKRNEERFKVMAEFCTVYGVGPGKAREWYNKGYRSVEEVRKREANLSSQQRMGLKYWDDLKLRIPRTEVEELAAAVVDAVKTMEPDILHTVVGGYRRGKPDSGDVDVLLASPTEGAERGLLRALVEELRRRNFIAELLMFTEHTPADSAKEHNGVAKEGFGVDCLDKAYCIVRSPTSGKFRQMDIVVSPIGCYGCAVVGWSGSTMFERSIREYSAREKGLQFQSWGIFDKATGERIDCRDERDVFRILKLNYIPPEMRCA